MRTSIDLRFEKGDPVREYWLAHGEGFAVENRRGRVVGQVVDVVVDPTDQHVVSLVVRRTVGLSELPAEEIEAVVPARESFVLDGAGPRREKPAPRARAARIRPGVGRALRHLVRLGPRLERWASPRLRLAGRALGVAWITVWTWLVGLARILARELERRQ